MFQTTNQITIATMVAYPLLSTNMAQPTGEPFLLSWRHTSVESLHPAKRSEREAGFPSSLMQNSPQGENWQICDTSSAVLSNFVPLPCYLFPLPALPEVKPMSWKPAFYCDNFRKWRGSMCAIKTWWFLVIPYRECLNLNLMVFPWVFPGRVPRCALKLCDLPWSSARPMDF